MTEVIQDIIEYLFNLGCEIKLAKFQGKLFYRVFYKGFLLDEFWEDRHFMNLAYKIEEKLSVIDNKIKPNKRKFKKYEKKI